MVLVALRPIRVGEEVRISYLQDRKVYIYI